MLGGGGGGGGREEREILMEYAGMIRMMDRYGSLDQFVNVDFFLSFLILSSHIYTFCLLVSLSPSLSLSLSFYIFVCVHVQLLVPVAMAFR